ncbi:hypothetical protein L0657_15655 [Dyadobacter sp. CY345]|uniref:hypothetical protein n=1 Tax=Dyadobacter sp. CY345 TaxID=2909335 RepID=UPI001F1809A7|nr:hypothetical protein [Dyadobacter sp. CY345]MCF2445398.1 hypothetical protein [Dyadobacter sp. CY345]
MAVNKPTGDGRRIGAVRQRSQFEHNGMYFKRDAETGRIMDGKQDGTPFKGVRHEK